MKLFSVRIEVFVCARWTLLIEATSVDLSVIQTVYMTLRLMKIRFWERVSTFYH